MHDQPLWQLHDVSKRFGPVLANNAVSLALRAGKIHGLLGENGSGKSTLIKLLSGAYQPDAGTILHAGQPVRLASPAAARRHGVATVFQEFSLIPQLSVAENIALGRWGGRRFNLDWTGIRAEAARILGQLGIDIDPEASVVELSVAQQQLVEIAKAMAQDATMLILDEPTTALAAREAEHLFALLRRLRDDGTVILYVSHRLEEVVRLVDCATILRNGGVVSPATDTPITIDGIVERMIGGSIATHYPKENNAGAEPLLEVRGLASTTGIAGIDFTLNRGEVLGLGGPLGSGRTEIVRAIFGADRLTAGEIFMRGRPVHFASPADAIAAGIALLTENRKSDGLFLNFDTGGNITIANLAALSGWLGLDLARERQVTGALGARLQLNPPDPGTPIDGLSGGNQQKAIIGRWLHAEADVFLLDEPTQGIDVGARAAIYRLINELTAAGKGIVLVSSDDDELLSMSDRIALIQRKRLVRIAPVAAVSRASLQSFGEEVA